MKGGPRQKSAEEEMRTDPEGMSSLEAKNTDLDLSHMPICV